MIKAGKRLPCLLLPFSRFILNAEWQRLVVPAHSELVWEPPSSHGPADPVVSANSLGHHQMGLGKGHRHDLSGVPTVVTENVEDYRNAIPVYLTKDDVVLECGAAQGVTTSLIAEVAADVVGIDLSTFQTEGAQRRHPNVCFYNMDAYDGSAIRKLGGWQAMLIHAYGFRTAASARCVGSG